MKDLDTDWEIHVSAGGDFEDFGHKMGGTDIRFSTSCESDTGMLYSAYSRHVDCCKSLDSKFSRIFSLEVFLNGARRFHESNWNVYPIRFYEVNDGSRTYKIDSTGFDDYPFCTSPEPVIRATEDSGFLDPNRHYVSKLIHESKNCRFIRALLIDSGLISTHKTTSRILSWNLLYKMLDTVKTSLCHDGQQVSPGFISKTDLKKFTSSCNTVAALGVYARHGITGHARSKATVTDFNEAADIIFPMCRDFLRKHKHNESCLTEV